MSGADKRSRVALTLRPFLVFYACDEVSENERKLIDEHLAVCASCAEQLAGERSLWEAMERRESAGRRNQFRRRAVVAMPQPARGNA